MNLILFFLFFGSSGKWMGDDEAYFIPFWILSGSTSRVEPEWRQSVYYIIPKNPKIRVPLLRKKKWHKVAPDDNNNNNRDETLFPPISQIARQT